MKYYIELMLMPDSEIPLNFLWQKLFKQIHIGLAENKNADGASAIGVSFPEYDAAEFLLGSKLRLFAKDEGALEKLQCEKWLSRLKDYVHIGSIRPVPDIVAGYACFCQLKPKGSNERLARRRARKLGVAYEDALAFFENTKARNTSKNKHSKLPYINMHSETNGHRFRLFIDLKIEEQQRPGTFSSYGLSSRDADKQATVPQF